MVDNRTLKNLNKALFEANKELDKLKLDSSITNKKIVGKKQEIKVLLDKIYKVKQKGVIITEHALLRYLERVKGIDMEQIKKEILQDTRINDAINVLGSGSYPIKGGTLIVKDNVIITITE